MQKNIPSDLVTYLILMFMEDKPSYGYEIIKQLKTMSNGYWELSYGTVYGAITRLENAGLIKRCKRSTDNRKYYELTTQGKKNLAKRKEAIAGMGDMSKRQVLGFLNVYREIHGQKRFLELLNEINKEFC